MRLVNVAVMGIYEKPDSASVFESQKIYGRLVEVIEKRSDTWVKVVTWDGVVGYAREYELVSDNPVWRMSKNLQRIKSLTGCVYPSPSVVNQTIIRLAYNTYISVVDIQENWAQVQLIDGTLGWVMTDDIEPITILSCEEMLTRAKMFLGLPYIWGGTSSFGFDCSGFTQTLMCQMGYPMRRFSRDQEADPAFQKITLEEVQPGDLLYFGKESVTHTALCITPGKMIHATAIDNTPRLIITDITHPTLQFRCARRIPAVAYDMVTHCY